MTSLYTKEQLDRVKRKDQTGRALVWGLSTVSLAACVALCLNTRMGNERTMYLFVVAVSILGGWTVMALLFFYWLPWRAERRHMEGILKGEEEEAIGVLHWTDTLFAIPRSITVRKMNLETDQGLLSLQADNRLIRALPKRGTRVRVRFVRRYITAWEETDAEA